MILESIVTTINEDGTPNVSPMGPTVPETFTEGNFESFELRPFDSSRTFANLKRTKVGVMHVTDDAELFALSAIGKLDPLPAMCPAEKIDGNALSSACRWYEFRVEYIDETGPRMSLNCRTVHSVRNRDFWGFNRAKHAVIEAAILATRLDFLPAEEIRDQFERLATIVAKTGGSRETGAFERLNAFVKQAHGASEDSATEIGKPIGKPVGESIETNNAKACSDENTKVARGGGPASA